MTLRCFPNLLDVITVLSGFPGALMVKKPPANAGHVRDTGSIPGSGRLSWRRAWQPNPIFLPGESPWTEEPGGLQSIGSQSQT